MWLLLVVDVISSSFLCVYVDENLLHDNLIFWWKIASYHICAVTEFGSKQAIQATTTSMDGRKKNKKT